MKKEPGEGLLFEFKDVYYTDRQGKNSPWRRINVSELKTFQMEQAENFNCFASIQTFLQKTKPEKKGELHIAPMYFDLDYENNPDIAKQEAVKVIDFFIKELGLEPYDIRVFFSGSKGFHILIDEQALGVQPREDLQKVYKYLAGYIKNRLGTWVQVDGKDTLLPLESIDLVVYTCPRMLRLPNSVHQKTKLHKVELNLDELELPLEILRTIAAKPRHDTELKYTGVDRQEIKPRPKAVKMYQDKVTEYEDMSCSANVRYDKESYNFTKDKPPVCVKDILEKGWKKPGDRNNATVQLGCYFKAAGYTKEETTDILDQWVIKFTSATTGYDKRQRVANTRNVIESVFARDNEYKFGCAFIRSLHGEKNGSKDYERVPCASTLCHCLKRTGVQEAEPVQLHLAMTGNAEYTGKRIKTKIMVAGKKHTPYIIPSNLEFTCWGSKGCKKFHCPLLQIPSHTAYRDLCVSDRELIEMCGVGDDNIKGILKRVSGIPSCGKYDMYINKTVNVDELLVIPMAEDNQTINLDDSNKGKYVLRKVYSVGTLNIKENKYYEITGFVFAHPKNQEGTIIIENVTPLQDIVDSFQLTDKIKKELQAFKPVDYSLDAIRNKLQVLCDSLTYNVTYIVERDEVLLGALLVYHSVLLFNVPWDVQTMRGWLECIVLGDSATGKSHLLKALMGYIGLGTCVDAESTSRTGLTYKMEQSGAGGNWYIVWGAWPLADKEIIWIDEAASIDKKEYGEMTMARSEGKLVVKRAVTAETTCRVRAILSSNPPDPKGYGSNTMADRGNGVEWLKEIFNAEDLRRFDFGLFLRTGDVSKDLFNKELSSYPVTVTAENLRNNILFAWSRTPEQVIIPLDTVNKIREMTTVLSNIYGNVADIPLVSPSDQRNKLARLSVALAALTHSVDETGENLIVYPGHVEYIFYYLKGVYNAPGCRLNNYNKIANHVEELSDKKYDSIMETLRRLDPFKSDTGFFNFIKLFAKQTCLGLSDIEAMLAITKEETKALIGLLQQTEMITKRSNGYYKNAKFNAFIDRCFEKGIFDEVGGDPE